MSGAAQGGGGGLWSLLGMAPPAASSASTSVQDMLRDARLGTPIFHRRLGRMRAEGGIGEAAVVSATAAPPQSRLDLAADSKAAAEAEGVTAATVAPAAAPAPVDELPLLATVAGRSLPSVQLLSRVRVIVPLHGPDAVARLPWLASAVAATGGSAAPLLQLARLAADAGVGDGGDAEDDADGAAVRAPVAAASSAAVFASLLAPAAVALRPVHLAAALALPLAEPSLRLHLPAGGSSGGGSGEAAACLSAELLATSTYYAYPADWWSPGLLAATVGVAQRLHAAVVEEWRKTVVAQQAAAARAAAAAQAQALM